MRVATFNANSIRSRFNVLVKWLELHQPDILAIQETKVQDVDFPVSDFARTGYEIIFRGQKKYNGVSIFSKEKPTEVIATLPQDTTGQARFLKARIGNVTLINTYIPQGGAIDSDKFQYKLDWYRWQDGQGLALLYRTLSIRRPRSVALNWQPRPAGRDLHLPGQTPA